MKTILFKIQQFPLISETFIVNQIIMAIELGFDVKILIKDLLKFEESSQAELLEKYKISDKIIFEQFDIPQNKFWRLLKVIGIVLSRITNFLKVIKYVKLKSKFSLTWIFEIAFYDQFKNIDIIHVQYGTNVHPIDILKKAGFIDSRLIVSFHGHDAFFPINGLIPRDGYYDYLVNEGDWIIANTPYLKQQLMKIGFSENKIEVIPVPVDTDYFTSMRKRKRPNNPIRLISVGRLESIKGHRYGILATDILVRKGIDVKYFIIGEGSNRKELESLIHLKQLDNHVNLLGKRTQREIRVKLRQADIYLMTSVTFNNQIKETQGLATIEAQSCGLPVVAFDSGGVRYTIIHGETGFLCEEENFLKFAEYLERLINNKKLRDKFSQNAEKFVKEHYSRKMVFHKWRLIYNR
ncbi:glycosyltransferase family 4 protein [Christiangramia aquimixticola]|uniref:glycosyltransferase family 4 protein n=1 Tax=Christiangramia aquimixticola TaxID=1697558 RepID=UPI003AA862C4